MTGLRSVPNGEGAVAHAPAATEAVDILIVDDRAENLLALEAILDSPKYELVRANSGEEAIRHVERRDFSVVLLDVQMPTLDGFETAMRLRSVVDGSRATVPIIFETAIDATPARVLQAYAESEIGRAHV